MVGVDAGGSTGAEGLSIVEGVAGRDFPGRAEVGRFCRLYLVELA